jgi:cytochrome c oxidase assembly protein subunit 15
MPDSFEARRWTADHAMSGASTDAGLRRGFATAALVAIVLTLAVIGASAFIRHSQSGLSCADWPACYARVGDAAGDASLPRGVETARRIHRLTATGTAIVLLAMLLFAWTQRSAWRRERKLVLAALVVVGALGALGIATSGTRLPAVVLGNLLGGFLLLAVLTATFATVAFQAPGRATSSRIVAVAALALALAQAATGGLIGAQFASISCPALTHCGDWSWREFLGGEAWNPLRATVAANGHFVSPAGAAGLHVLHRAFAVLVLAIAFAVAATLRHAQPRLALAIAILAVLESCSGLAAVIFRPGLETVLVHNAGAALLVALLAAAAVRRRHDARTTSTPVSVSSLG